MSAVIQSAYNAKVNIDMRVKILLGNPWSNDSTNALAVTLVMADL